MRINLFSPRQPEHRRVTVAVWPDGQRVDIVAVKNCGYRYGRHEYAGPRKADAIQSARQAGCTIIVELRPARCAA